MCVCHVLPGSHQTFTPHLLCAERPGENVRGVWLLPFRYTRSSQEGRKTSITKTAGRNKSYHAAMAEGDIHSDQTLITDVPQGRRLLSLHLRTGGRAAFRGAATYSEGTSASLNGPAGVLLFQAPSPLTWQPRNGTQCASQPWQLAIPWLGTAVPWVLCTRWGQMSG